MQRRKTVRVNVKTVFMGRTCEKIGPNQYRWSDGREFWTNTIGTQYTAPKESTFWQS